MISLLSRHSSPLSLGFFLLLFMLLGPGWVQAAPDPDVAREIESPALIEQVANRLMAMVAIRGRIEELERERASRQEEGDARGAEEGGLAIPQAAVVAEQAEASVPLWSSMLARERSSRWGIIILSILMTSQMKART